jgi:hypothetical protein
MGMQFHHGVGNAARRKVPASTQPMRMLAFGQQVARARPAGAA